MFEEMEMPTPCQKCNTVFDLNDGCGSEKWYPNTVICIDCHLKECDEIEKDLQILDLKENIANAEFDLKAWKEGLNNLETVPK